MDGCLFPWMKRISPAKTFILLLEIFWLTCKVFLSRVLVLCLLRLSCVCLSHPTFSRNDKIRCRESEICPLFKDYKPPYAPIGDLMRYSGCEIFSFLNQEEMSRGPVKAPSELWMHSAHVHFLCRCSVSFRGGRARQRHETWRTGVSCNLLLVTQMKSWEQPGCWQDAERVLGVPPSTSAHNWDLCKHHSSWSNGLCTLSKNRKYQSPSPQPTGYTSTKNNCSPK